MNCGFKSVPRAVICSFSVFEQKKHPDCVQFYTDQFQVNSYFAKCKVRMMHDNSQWKQTVTLKVVVKKTWQNFCAVGFVHKVFYTEIY